MRGLKKKRLVPSGKPPNKRRVDGLPRKAVGHVPRGLTDSSNLRSAVDRVPKSMTNEHAPSDRIDWTRPHVYQLCKGRGCQLQALMGDHCLCAEKKNAPIHVKAEEPI